MQVPVIETDSFLARSEGFEASCVAIAESLHKYGAVIIRDPRVE